MNGMAVSGTPARRRHVLRVQRLHARARCASPRCRGYKTAFVWTHDSVGLGEDGPTHQPIEQLASLRAMPGLRRHPPRRRQRGRARRGGCTSTATGPTALDPHPPERPGARRHRRARPRRRAARARTSSSTRPATASTSCSRHRLRGVAVRRRASSARRRRALGARRVDAVVGPLRRAARRLPRAGAARPTCRRSRSRPGATLRLGALRRRRRRYRPLRRVGARRRSRSPKFGFTPENVAARARALLENGDTTDEPERDRPAQRLRPEPVVRQPRPPAAHRRRAGEARRRRRHPRRHVEPDDPRQGDRRRRGLRRAARRSARRQGLSIEDTYWEVVLDDIVAATDVLRPVYDAHERRRRVRVGRGVARARARHRRHDRGGASRCSRGSTGRT